MKKKKTIAYRTGRMLWKLLEFIPNRRKYDYVYSVIYNMADKLMGKTKIMKEITLIESEDGKRFIFSFYSWLFRILYNINIKRGWLNNWNNQVWDDYDMIDTLGSHGDIGRFIETYSCEIYYQETIKTKFLTINLVY